MDRETLLIEFTYDKETGVFTRNFKRGSMRKGTVAGCVKRGYVVLNHRNKTYPAARLAYIYCHGDIPSGMIVDHIDGDGLNNRISNIRLATPALNMQNLKKDAFKCSSGLSGTYKRGAKWSAQISYKGKTYHLGMFATEEEAGNVYSEAKEKIHVFSRKDTTIDDFDDSEAERMLSEFRIEIKLKGQKIAAKDVLKIRDDTRDHSVIAKEYGIYTKHVTNIKARRRWKNI